MIQKRWHIGTYIMKVRILYLKVSSKASWTCEEMSRVEVTTNAMLMRYRLLRIAEHSC